MNIIEKIAKLKQMGGFVNNWSAFIPKNPSYNDFGGMGELYLIGLHDLVSSSQKSSNNDYKSKAKKKSGHLFLEEFTDSIVIVSNSILDRHEIWINSSSGPVEVAWKLKHSQKDFDFDYRSLNKQKTIFEIKFKVSNKKYLLNSKGTHISLEDTDQASINEYGIVCIYDPHNKLKETYNTELNKV